MPERGRGRPPHPDLLTPAERRVLEELRKGGTNAEIAVRIGIGPETVKTHVSNMLAKLELDDRQQLASWREEDAPRRRWLIAPFLVRPLVVAGVVAGVAAVIVVALWLLVLLGGGEQPYIPPERPAGVLVSAGGQHTCALRESGELTCWGRDAQGQAPEPAVGFRSVSVGGNEYSGVYACAVRDSGEVVCWGVNKEGRAAAPPGTYHSVSAGVTHTCAVRTSGEIDCWGHNYRGRADAPSGKYLSVSVGAWHSCALRDSGRIRCWGSNQNGQTDEPSGRFQAVTSGWLHSCALRDSGEVLCWGAEQPPPSDDDDDRAPIDYGQADAPPAGIAP